MVTSYFPTLPILFFHLTIKGGILSMFPFLPNPDIEKIDATDRMDLERCF